LKSSRGKLRGYAIKNKIASKKFKFCPNLDNVTQGQTDISSYVPLDIV